MSEQRAIGVGVIGLGFMGCTHVRAYQAAEAAGLGCKLIAVADRSAERLGGQAFVQGNIDTGRGEQLFDPGLVRGYVDPREMLHDPRVDVVSICTHTDTHVDLGVAALRAGKHVLVEKPVATTAAEVRRLAVAAKEAGKLCVPAMVMRHWPEWVWLREAVRNGVYGKATSASFQRMGAVPGWTDFYRDATRSGGAIMDVHIHDADFIRWCFGEPMEVASTGTAMHVTTLYRFGESGPASVVAEGAQDCSPGFVYRIRYTVVFEKATADFDLTRTPTLLLYRDGRSDAVAIGGIGAGSAYDAEVREFVKAVAMGQSGAEPAGAIEDAVKTASLLETELQSLTRRISIRIA